MCFGFDWCGLGLRFTNLLGWCGVSFELCLMGLLLMRVVGFCWLDLPVVDLWILVTVVFSLGRLLDF